MLTLSNALTLLRLPAAFLFTVDSVIVRVGAIILAVISDCLDGYYARKHKTVSQLGAVLDPIMDKFFVYFALGILVVTRHITLWIMAAVISRDFFLFLLGLYITIAGAWESFEFKSIVWGKITTALQFVVLFLLVIGISLPGYVYLVFIPLGFLTALGLYSGFKKRM